MQMSYLKGIVLFNNNTYKLYLLLKCFVLNGLFFIFFYLNNFFLKRLYFVDSRCTVVS